MILSLAVNSVNSSKQSKRSNVTNSKAEEYEKYILEAAGHVYANNDIAKVYGNYSTYQRKLDQANADGKITNDEYENLNAYAAATDKQATEAMLSSNNTYADKNFRDEEKADIKDNKGGVQNVKSNNV